jgi:hypothetical protein
VEGGLDAQLSRGESDRDGNKMILTDKIAVALLLGIAVLFAAGVGFVIGSWIALKAITHYLAHLKRRTKEWAEDND